MKTYHIISNPTAGKKGALKNLKITEEVFASRGVKFQTHLSHAERDATDIARMLTEAGETEIVTIGGDGTLHEVLNGLADPTACHLGLIPSGTGNDFAEKIALPLDAEKQMLVSVAAGISFEQFESWVGEKMTVFRVIPNTAISQLESMTLIASHHASKEQEQLLLDIFNEMGLAMLIPEKQMAATTALTSCGIAYVLKYIQAAMQAGIELGVYPKDAQRMVAQSVKGAASLILNNDTHPSVEIDKVTTPGGITIRGINELDHEGFSSAIIKAMKISCVK